jgi:hypothetical protein
MISMKLIRGAFALTAATAMAALITLTASACGGATTATSTTTNGLENKSPADVLQNAASALAGAKSVHVVGTGHSLRLDIRMQDDSATGTFTVPGTPQVKFTIIGSDGYINTDQAGLKAMGAPPSVQRLGAGRWLKVPVSDLKGFTLADMASQLTAYRTRVTSAAVRQATLDGKNVVVISRQDGWKLYVANTGPAYPLHAEFKKGSDADVVNYTEYDAPLHITAPSNAIDVSNAS